MPKIDYAREANRIAKKIVYDATRDPVDEIMKEIYRQNIRLENNSFIKVSNPSPTHHETTMETPVS